MIEMLWTPATKWAVFGMGLLLLEIFSQSFFILFFGLGALVVFLLLLLVDLSVNAQLAIFAASSVVLLLTLRNYIRDVFFLPTMETDGELEEMFIGKKAKVIDAVGPDKLGRVEFNGSLWAASSDDDIDVNSVVEIVGKDNITLEVKAL